MVLPDIAAGRSVAEEAMADRCRILRDQAGHLDDVLNRTTGKLERPAGDETTVYEGKCGPTRETAVDARRAEGGRTAHYRAWRTRIPMDAPMPREGDRVVVLVCRGDANLIGRRFKVVDVTMGTVGVTRILGLEDEMAATAH